MASYFVNQRAKNDPIRKFTNFQQVAEKSSLRTFNYEGSPTSVDPKKTV